MKGDGSLFEHFSKDGIIIEVISLRLIWGLNLVMPGGAFLVPKMWCQKVLGGG